MIGNVYRLGDGYWRVKCRWAHPGRKTTWVCTLHGEIEAILGRTAAHSKGSCRTVEIKGTVRNVLLERVYKVRGPTVGLHWWPVEPRELMVRPFRGLRRA